jgi:hypothetical protein
MMSVAGPQRRTRTSSLTTRTAASAVGSQLGLGVSVAIPVATRGQAVAFPGTDLASRSALASSPGTHWRFLAALVTDSPLPHSPLH